MATAIAQDLIERDGDRLKLNFHPGQSRAWDSQARWVTVLAGIQSGKTSWGPLWLQREIMRCGPGDYIVATPTYPLLEKKLLPEFKRLFETYMRYGKYVGSPIKHFVFTPEAEERLHGKYDPERPTQILFGYAADADSLASMTAKAAWLDEVGMDDFKEGSWNEIRGRLAINRGRALLTTRLYNFGWLKRVMYDPWKRAERCGEPTDVEVIRFDSTENPSFPPEEFEEQRRKLPPHVFDMMYRAIYTRPAGMIYNSFDEAKHTVGRFEIPEHWPRYLGLDFGAVNTAGVLVARQPGTRRQIIYRTYNAGGRTAAEHAYHLFQGQPGFEVVRGGSKSEGQWRNEFYSGGVVNGQRVSLFVEEPDITDVELGISRVYGAFARDEIEIFDDLTELIEDLNTYSRELDDAGQPTEKIEDKETYHRLDALRYIENYLCGVPMAAQWGRELATDTRY